MGDSEDKGHMRFRRVAEILAAVAAVLAIVTYLTGFYGWLDTEIHANGSGGGSTGGGSTGGGSTGGGSTGGGSTGGGSTNLPPRWLDKSRPISGSDTNPTTGVETVAGVPYGHSVVQLHDESCCDDTPITTTYAVPKGYSRLRVKAGIGDDSAANDVNQPQVFFEILINGTQVVKQITVSWTEQAVPITVPLQGASTVTLSSGLLTANCAICGAQAAWAKAQLLSHTHS